MYIIFVPKIIQFKAVHSKIKTNEIKAKQLEMLTMQKIIGKEIELKC